MTHAHRLLLATVALFAGCSDFTPVEGRLINGGDGSAVDTYNGCTSDMFVDRTAVGADRTVGFGGENGSTGYTFAPKCIAVAAGQSITFVGALASHPLNPGIPGNNGGGDPGNPIALTMTGTSVTFAFPRPGTYPFFCGMHGFLGMNGVVVVR